MTKAEAKTEAKLEAKTAAKVEAKTARDLDQVRGASHELLPLPLLLVRAGAVPPLLRMLQSFDSETQRHAARAIANILSHSSPRSIAARTHELECRREVLRHGGLAQLMAMSRSTGQASAELQLLAAKSLASMSKLQSLSSSW
jgi:HEAT repeat protein